MKNATIIAGTLLLSALTAPAVAAQGEVDLPYGPDTCVQGFVWREAFPDDHVCVTAETRAQAAEDNKQASARREPGGGAYGPDTCLQGYVWREARPGDHVCVTAETRAQAAEDNSRAASRRASAMPAVPRRGLTQPAPQEPATPPRIVTLPGGASPGSTPTGPPAPSRDPNVLPGPSKPKPNTCEGQGSACKVHPAECRGRGTDWIVSGTIQCVSGKPKCVAVAGKDYCNWCGKDCGGCLYDSCSKQNLCSPGQQCVNYRHTLYAQPRWQCQTIGFGCTKIPNLCWTKDEVGIAQLGCKEGRQ